MGKGSVNIWFRLHFNKNVASYARRRNTNNCIHWEKRFKAQIDLIFQDIICNNFNVKIINNTSKDHLKLIQNAELSYYWTDNRNISLLHCSWKLPYWKQAKCYRYKSHLILYSWYYLEESDTKAIIKAFRNWQFVSSVGETIVQIKQKFKIQRCVKSFQIYWVL